MYTRTNCTLISQIICGLFFVYEASYDNSINGA